MASLRQKLSRVRQVNIETVIIESPIDVKVLQLQDRDQTTGNWTATDAAGELFGVTKRGVNSGVGLQIPSLAVKQGVGRFAN